MATKKTTGSKEPKPKAHKATPTKPSSSSRTATKAAVAPSKAKAAAVPSAAKARTPASKPSGKAAGKAIRKGSAKVSGKAATKPTLSGSGAPDVNPAKQPRSAKASTKRTTKSATDTTRGAKARAPAEPRSRTASMPLVKPGINGSATIDRAVGPALGATETISDPTGLDAIAEHAAHDGTPVQQTGTPNDAVPEPVPSVPAVKPIFRRVGNAWMKFDPSDLEGIAKAEAEAAAIALNPELAPPPPAPAKRPEPRRDQQPRGQRQPLAAAAVLEAAPEHDGGDDDGSPDDIEDGQGWEGPGDGHNAPEPPAPIEQVTGVLDIAGNEARLRQFGGNGWVPSHDEPQVPAEFVQRFNLRNGNLVTVNVQMVRVRKRRGPKKLRRMVVGIESVEGLEPSAWAARPPYGELTSIDPQPRMHLEYRGCPPACRLIDLFCPIGFGTRGLIVAPPKAGKTILLQQIAHGIKHNHPQVELIALLIDERPEEVTDFRRNVPALVLASSNDQDLERHTQMGIMAIERARRLFEAGKDVVVLLDSLTRLGRAFNNNRRYSTGGRTMSGGLDSRALDVPKQLFGAARKAEEGGSLTIIATCLVDTGSRADQVIFEEFKGTGNMELILDRSIAERRVYPAINLAASGTRKEHLLMGERELKTMTALRRRLMTMPPFVQVEQLVAAVNRTTDNETLVRGSGG